jgi:subtilisin family serine protease
MRFPGRSDRTRVAAALAVLALAGLAVAVVALSRKDGTEPTHRTASRDVLQGLREGDTIVDATNRDAVQHGAATRAVEPGTAGPDRATGGLADEPAPATGKPAIPVAGTDVPSPPPHGVIVRFEGGTSGSERADARADADVRPGTPLPVSRMEVVSPERGTTVGEAVRKLEDNPDVAYAEPDVSRTALATPSDPLFAYQWALHNVGQTVGGYTGTPGDDIAGTSAWNVATSAPGIVVAVVDTGVDLTHPDLAPNLWHNPREVPGNGIDDDGNGYIDDVVGWDFNGNDAQPQDAYGHGTHVAGIIAARGNDGVGVTGVAWQAGILPLQALGADGSGRASDVISAWAYAARMGVPIVNASIGGAGSSQAERDVIASASNTLFVVAAGNSGSDNDTTPEYPCSYDLPNVLCVAATDSNDTLASFSNRGPGAVDLAAPGVAIASSYPGGRWMLMSGTSMATPYVSGVAALALARNPGISAAQLRDLLLSKVTPEPSLRGVVATGGVLDAAAVLGAPRSAPAARPVPGVTPAPTQPAQTRPATDRRPPVVRLTVSRASAGQARRRGITVRARCSERCTLRFEVRVGSRRLGSGRSAPGAAAQTVSRRLHLTSRALRELRRGRLLARVRAVDRAGNRRTVQARVRLRH